MRLFKFEMHLHTSGTSACGVSTAEEMVTAAHMLGYSGIVVTNHFFHGNTAVSRSLTWHDFVDAYYQDYLTAKAVGDKIGLQVLFGIEEVYEPGKEALIYGLDPQLLMHSPRFKDMKLPEMAQFVHENGGFIACAHPFRARGYIPNPTKEPDLNYFDAIEVYNQHNEPAHNQMAADFAARTGIPVIAGGDCHLAANLGPTGLAFFNPILTNEDLVKALKSGDYRLMIDSEIQ